MPVELTDLFSRRARKVQVVWGDGPDDCLTVTYKPDKFTNALNAEMQKASETDGATAMATLLCALVADTDITEDGKPFPLTPENLERLGLPLLVAISEAVQDDFSLGKRKVIVSGTDSHGT